METRLLGHRVSLTVITLRFIPAFILIGPFLFSGLDLLLGEGLDGVHQMDRHTDRLGFTAVDSTAFGPSGGGLCGDRRLDGFLGDRLHSLLSDFLDDLFGRFLRCFLC